MVLGEIVDELDEAFSEAMALDPLDLISIPSERLDHTVYHFHPSLEQVRQWIVQAGLSIEEEGSGE